MTNRHQESLFDEEEASNPGSPAAKWEKDSTKRALDELFSLTQCYNSTRSYRDLVQFVAKFRFYSPFNAMLVHVQMPGARYVAPAHRWLDKYGRRIRSDARPLVILQPKGPVMFVFDVSDTEPTKEAPPLPPEVERPFEVRQGRVGAALEKLIYNAIRDGVRVSYSRDGSQSAGSNWQVVRGLRATQEFQIGVTKQRKPVLASIPVRYDILIGDRMSRESQFVTIVHELAHLYCGHIGTANTTWWPDRRGLDRNAEEFEAESVAYLVCSRSGVDNPSEQYLAGYLEGQNKVPAISLECVMKAAGLVETMSREKMKVRKEFEKYLGE